MKNKKLIFYIITALLFSIVSCKNDCSIIIKNAPVDSSYHVKKGKCFTIELDSQTSTGFGWHYIQSDNIKIVSGPETIIVSPGIPGSPDMQAFTFIAPKEGNFTIDLFYGEFRSDQSKAVKKYSIAVISE